MKHSSINEVLITVTSFIWTDLSLDYSGMKFLKTLSSFAIYTSLLFGSLFSLISWKILIPDCSELSSTEINLSDTSLYQVFNC